MQTVREKGEVLHVSWGEAYTPEQKRDLEESVGKLLAAQPDPVKRPAHYTTIFKDLPVHCETWDVVEAIVKHYPDPVLAGQVMQIIQYLIRAPHKGNLLQDLQKAEVWQHRATNQAASLKQSPPNT